MIPTDRFGSKKYIDSGHPLGVNYLMATAFFLLVLPERGDTLDKSSNSNFCNIGKIHPDFLI